MASHVAYNNHSRNLVKQVTDSLRELQKYDDSLPTVLEYKKPALNEAILEQTDSQDQQSVQKQKDQFRENTYKNTGNHWNQFIPLTNIMSEVPFAVNTGVEAWDRRHRIIIQHSETWGQIRDHC